MTPWPTPASKASSTSPPSASSAATTCRSRTSICGSTWRSWRSFCGEGLLLRSPPVVADRALPIPPHVHPRQQSHLDRQLTPRGVLDGDLGVRGQERGDRLQELVIGGEVVGRIGVDKVEGMGGEAGEAFGEGEAADLQQAFAQLAG